MGAIEILEIVTPQMIVMMQNDGIVGVRNKLEHIRLNGIDSPGG